MRVLVPVSCLLLAACSSHVNLWGPSAYADRSAKCHGECAVVVTNAAPETVTVYMYTPRTKWRALGRVSTNATDTLKVTEKRMPGVIVARKPPIGETVPCVYDGPNLARVVRLTCGGAARPELSNPERASRR